MKIRYKLLVTEIIISFVLFLSMLFTIQSALLLIEYDDLKIQIEEVRGNVERMRFQIISMVAEERRSTEVTTDYALSQNILSFSIQNLTSNPNLAPLQAAGHDIKGPISGISTKWEENKRLLPATEAESYLSYRRRRGGGQYFSLLATKSAVGKSSIGSDDPLLRKIESVVTYLLLVETEYAIFERLVYSAISDLNSALDDFKSSRLLLINLVLGSALLFSLVVILWFSILTGRRVSILEKTLGLMSSGNLNLRIPTIGNDEFASLGYNVNTIVNTLQGRINSFQTLMGQAGRMTEEDTIDSEKMESVLLKLVIQETKADGAGLYLVTGIEGNLFLSSAEGYLKPIFPLANLSTDPDNEDILALLHSRWISKGKTLVGKCAVEGEGKFCPDVPNSDYSWRHEESSPLFVSSFILLPLRIGSSVLGVLLLTSSKPKVFFTPLEYLNMQSYAGLLSVAVDNIYKYKEILDMAQLSMEIDVASEIQDKLIPKQLPRLPNGSASYMSRRIKGLNGDYFEVRDMGKGKCLITLCELTGRGVPAGLLMGMLRALIILVISPEKGATAILNEINQKMSQGLSMENYASVRALVIDADGCFTFSSASHSPIHIFRAKEGKYETITNTGLPIGIDPDAQYEQKNGKLGPDDVVLMFTDGITDSQNETGSFLGADKLLSTLSTWAEEPPEQITESFQNFLEDFEGEHAQQDDQTLLVYKHDKEGWN